MTGPAIPRFRDLGLALGWGAGWGTGLGFWLVVPALLPAHHLVPRSVAESLALGVGLGAVFAIGGALLNVVACFPLVAWRAVRGRDLADPPTAYGVATPVLLAVVYLAWSAGIEWVAFRGLAIAGGGEERLAGAAAALAAAGLGALAARRALDVLRASGRRRLLAAAVVVLVAGGIVRLAANAAPPDEPGEAPEPLRPLADGPPILFLGLDGANWTTLRPLLERGGAPTLERLLARGVGGEVDAPWPPHWSAPAWAAIVTGFPREDTGIHEDLAVLAPGLPPFQAPLTFDLLLNPIFSIEITLARAGLLRLVHPPRALLRRPPFWELLSGAGVATAVARFRFTFPAGEPGGVVVSDWAGEDQWSLLGLDHHAAPEELAAPAAEAPALLEPFARPEISTAPPLTRFVADPGHPMPADARRHPVEMLRFALDIDARTLEAARRMLDREGGDPGLLAVYLGGLDTVQHAFWQYRFPEKFPDAPPAPADVAALGPAIERYLEWLDEEIGDLAGRFASEPAVVVVSDHGYEAAHDNALWKGWHSARGGIFVAAGPGVPASAEPLEVGYLDVAPTILRLAGFAVPAEMPGRPLFRAPRPGGRRRKARVRVPRPRWASLRSPASATCGSRSSGAPCGGRRSARGCSHRRFSRFTAWRPERSRSGPSSAPRSSSPRHRSAPR